MVRGWAMVLGLHSSLLITPMMSTMAELVSITSLGPACIEVFTRSHSGFLASNMMQISALYKILLAHFSFSHVCVFF